MRSRASAAHPSPGARPIEDTGATARTVEWLTRTLQGLGLTVSEEALSPPPSSGRLVAEVRRADADPDSETESIEWAHSFAAHGRLHHRHRQLGLGPAGQPLRGGQRSDHAPYWEAGIPAIFLSDTGEFRWDTYHRSGDVADALDDSFLRGVAQATAAAVLELARR